MKMYLRILAVTLGIACLAAPAWADRPPSLYVLDTTSLGKVSSLIPERISSDLKERLAGSPKIEIAKRMDVGSKAMPANEALAKASRNYTAGIGLLVAEDFPGAAAKFLKAVELFEANLGDVDDYTVLKDALLRLGVAQLRAEFDDDALTTFKLWTTLDPTTQVSPETFGKAAVEVVAKSRRRAKRLGAGKLRINSTPEGAEVLVDGVSVGTTPITLAKVTPGLHYVVVRKDDSPTTVKKVSVRGKGKTENLVVDLTTGSENPNLTGGPMFYNELVGRQQKGEIDETLTPYLQELTTRTGASHATFAVVEPVDGKFSVTPFVYSAAEDRICVLEPESFSADLSDSTLRAHNLSLKIVAAVLEFPSERSLAANPFMAAVAAAPPSTPKPTSTDPKKPDAVTKTDDDPATAAPTLTPASDPAVTAAVDITDFGDTDLAAQSEWYKSWWLWTGIATIVLTSAAVGYVYLEEE
jgi:hypothetical protein